MVRPTAAQPSLWEDEAPGAGAEPATAVLRVPASADRALLPAAQAFNRALQRIAKLQSQLDELERNCLAHQAALAQTVQPLRQQHQQAQQQLLQHLCVHLDAPAQGLSKTQRHTLRDTVCQLAIHLQKQGVPGMEALHDRHSPQTLAQKRQADSEAMRQSLDELMGQVTGEALDVAADSDDPEAMLQAAMEQLRAHAAQAQAQRQARTEARKARQAARKAKQALSAQQQQATQALNDADTSLRQIYRQLASALHPDREQDPAERQRKNTLMGEANAAYERKDLVALLRLQLQAELVDPDHLERVSAERLQSLTLLLKQQAAELDKRRQHEQQRWAATFDVSGGVVLKPQYLRQCLHAERLVWETAVRGAQADVLAVGELATLKPWLNEQRRQAQQAERELAALHPAQFDDGPW